MQPSRILQQQLQNASVQPVLPSAGIDGNCKSSPTSSSPFARSVTNSDPIVFFLNSFKQSSNKSSSSDSEDVTSIALDGKQFKCNCGKVFKRQAQYIRHVDLAHSKTQSTHKCKICGKTFGNLNRLTMHMSVHDNKQTSFASLERTPDRAAHDHNSSATDSTSESSLDSAPTTTSTKRIKTVVHKRYMMDTSAINGGTTCAKTVGGVIVPETTVMDMCKSVSTDSNLVNFIVTKYNGSMDNHENSVKSQGTNNGNDNDTTSSLLNNNHLKQQPNCNGGVESPNEQLVDNDHEISEDIEPLTSVEPSRHHTDMTKEDSDKENDVNVSPLKVEVVHTSTHPHEQFLVLPQGDMTRTEKFVIALAPSSVVPITSHSQQQQLQHVHVQQQNLLKAQKSVTSQNALGPHAMSVSQYVTIPHGMSSGASSSTSVNQKMIQKYAFTSGPTPVHVAPSMLKNATTGAAATVSFTYQHTLSPNTCDPPPKLEPPTLSHITPIDNDDAPVRKSARLTGKVPGYKLLLQEDSGNENKPTKRRMSRTTSSEVESENDTEMSMNLLEMEAMECVDTNNQLFDKRQKRIGKERFPCDQCEKSFETETYLKMHKQAFHSKLAHLRNKLESQGVQKESMSGYVKNGNSWTCKICFKEFAQNSSYKNHMRTHSDERPFRCEICSIGFKERYHLKKHELFRHTEGAFETCSICGKKFKDSTAVRAHERIHSDLRPYKCRYCDRGFKTSECLWHHEHRSKSCGHKNKLVPRKSTARRGRPARKNAVKNMEKNEEVEQASMHFIQSQAIQYQQQQQLQHAVTESQSPTNQTEMMNEQAFYGLSSYNNDEEYYRKLQLHQYEEQMKNGVKVKAEPICNDLDLVNQVINDNQDIEEEVVTCDVDIIANNVNLQDLEDGPMLNDDGTLLIPHDSLNTSMEEYASTSSSGSLPYATSDSQDSTAFPQSEADVSRIQAVQYFDGSINQTSSQSTCSSTTVNNTTASIVTYAQQSIIQNAEGAHNMINIGTAYPVTSSLSTNFPSGAVYTTCNTASNSSNAGVPSTAANTSTYMSLQAVSSQHVEQVLENNDQDALQNVLRVKVPVLKLEENLQPDSRRAKTRQSKFTCSKCGKGFAVQAPYEKHLQRHNLKLPFECEICQISFKLRVHLNKHNLYKHSNEYPVQCSICGKNFKDSSAVKLHEKIHSNERPFNCPCGKSFKTNENLWGHENRKGCPHAPPREGKERKSRRKRVDIKQELQTDSSSNDCEAPQDVHFTSASSPAESQSSQSENESQSDVAAMDHVVSLATTNNQQLIEMPTYSTPSAVYVQATASIRSQDSAGFPGSVPHVQATVAQVPMQQIAPNTENTETSPQSLPSFATLTSNIRNIQSSPVQSLQLAAAALPKKQQTAVSPPKEEMSLASKYPEITNHLKKTVPPILPHIQHVFQKKQSMKPPPPYPGGNKVYPQSPRKSPAPSQMMINPDHMYDNSRDPFLRTPPPPPYNNRSRDTGSPYSVSSPGSQCTNTPGTPGSSASDINVHYWDDDLDNKAKVVTQYEGQSAELFNEVSMNVLNQFNQYKYQ